MIVTVTREYTTRRRNISCSCILQFARGIDPKNFDEVKRRIIDMELKCRDMEVQNNKLKVQRNELEVQHNKLKLSNNELERLVHNKPKRQNIELTELNNFKKHKELQRQNEELTNIVYAIVNGEYANLLLRNIIKHFVPGINLQCKSLVELESYIYTRSPVHEVYRWIDFQTSLHQIGSSIVDVDEDIYYFIENRNHIVHQLVKKCLIEMKDEEGGKNDVISKLLNDKLTKLLIMTKVSLR